MELIIDSSNIEQIKELNELLTITVLRQTLQY